MTDLVLGDEFGKFSQPKIHDRNFALAVEHNVGRLQVAMEDTFVVRSGQTGAELARNFQSLITRQASDTAEQRTKILAIDVLH